MREDAVGFVRFSTMDLSLAIDLAVEGRLRLSDFLFVWNDALRVKEDLGSKSITLALAFLIINLLFA